MPLPIRTISGGGDHPLLASDEGKFLDVDASLGNTVLLLPAANALPVGWHVPAIMKGDPSSGVVGFRVTQPGDRLNWFWDTAAPYPLWMNLSQDAAELICDGVSRFHLMGKSFSKARPQSQRTFVSTPSLQSFSIRPQDANEIIQINAEQADMGVYFDPVGHFTRGGYLSARVDLVRMDGSSRNVRVFASTEQTINGAPYIDLNGLHSIVRCYIDSARITLI